MKLFKKTLAMIMVMLTLFTTYTVAIPVFAENEDANITEVEENSEPEIVSEITEKREENLKHFMLSDGSFMVAQYNIPIHYQNKSGEWVDIDNTITKTDATIEQEELFGTDELYSTNNTVGNVVFAEKSNSNTLVSYEAKDYPISLNYQSAKKSYIEIIENNDDFTGNDSFLTLSDITQQVLYENVFDDVDLEYIVSSVGLKENIILKSKNAQNTFTVNYNIGGLTAEVVDIHTINLMAGEEIVYTITAPYMIDSNGEKSEGLVLEVDKNNNGKLRVNILVDNEWLREENRAYPVIIDPTIVTETERSAIQSVMISEGDKNKNYSGQAEMIVGREASEYGYSRTLVKINLPALKKGDIIVNAELNILNHKLDYYASTTPNMQVNAHRITSAWNYTTVTWNNQPSFDSVVSDYGIFEKLGSTGAWRVFNITKDVKQWYEDSTTNHGILLKGANTSGTYAENGVKAYMYSDNYNTVAACYPKIMLTYRNNKGLEDYWTYTTLSAGTAGTAYINDYTGNLVFIHGDVATTGLLMPVSLEHVYNGYMADKNNSTYPHSGKGFKLSLQQTVKSSGISAYPYIYEDGDGTQHYFYNDGTKYLDEDGLNLELKVLSGGGYTITDKSDNVMTFNSSGLLTQIADADGRKATLTYVTAKNKSGADVSYLKTVTDGAGHKITLTYNSGEGNSSQISKITGPDGKSITYTTSSGSLTKITYPDGTYSTYTYDSDGALLTATSADGYKLAFTYSTDGAKRVTSVTEYGGSTVGQTIKFTRDKLNQTQIRTAGKDTVIDNSDDIITTYQFDNWGRTVSTKMRLGNGTGLGAEKYDYTTGTVANGTDIGKRNRVSASAATGKSVDNLLVNHNCEGTNGWTSSYWLSDAYTSCGTAVYDTSQTYLGSKSIKINVNTATATGGLSMQQIVTNYVEAGKYTVSAYVKTNNLVIGTGAATGGACLASRVVNADGSVTRLYSNMLTGTTESSIDNGWQRIYLTFTVPNGATNVRVAPLLYNATGTAWFDCIQLEKSSVPNSYNLIENSSFERDTASWTAYNADSDDIISTARYNTGKQSYKLKGLSGKQKYIRQTVYVSGSEKDTYILSGNVRANSVPLDMSAGRRMDIAVRITYSDGTNVTKQPTLFNGDVYGQWQYSSGIFTLSDEDSSTNKTPVSIMIYCGYRKQANSCYFDDINLVKEPAPTYSYDSKGNLVSATENAQKNSTLGYDANDNLSSFTDERGENYTYTYSTSGNKHRLLSAVSAKTGVKYSYSYYDNGNLKAQEIVNAAGIAIRTGINYTDADTSLGIAEGAYVRKENDEHGYSTVYEYNLKSGLLNSVTDAEGNKTTYTYDANNDLLKSVSLGGKTVSYNYNTAGTRLASIGHNGFTYGFEYDTFGNTAKTKVNSTALMTNTYQGVNGNLIKSTYGNGAYKDYEYNHYGQTTKIKLNGSDAYSWEYNSTGQPYQHTDSKTGRVYKYVYDGLGRLIRSFGSTNGTNDNRFVSQLRYDKSNNVTKIINISDGTRTATNYIYDDANRPSKTEYGSISTTHIYESLGRLFRNTLNTTTPVTVTYSYLLSKRDYGDGDAYRSTQIGWEKIDNRTYGYEYDKTGNLVKFTEKKPGGTSYDERATYTYDALGQLTSEKNVDLGQKIDYTYDSGGNITQKNIYAYTSGTVGALQKTVNYTYDSTWKDKLISYDGDSITYDAIGNPLTYRDDMSFTWQGRQMASANLDGTAVTYKYNADGLRTYKKVGSTVSEYEYLGDKLIYEKRGNLQFHYRYDAYGNLGSITRINAAGSSYTAYVVCNSRGDVEEIRKADGTLYARYIYDSWGNTVKILDANGNTVTDPDYLSVQNPIRYRGYYWDSESGLYYLQSRYYDPVTGRFVNGDSLVDTSNVLGFNMYAYCGNNPVNNVDPTGHAWYHWALGAVIVAACAAATVITAGGFVAAAGAVAAVGSGVAAATTASTVAAGALIGSATAYGMVALSAASTSTSVKDFNSKGNWGTVSATAGGALLGGCDGYTMSKAQAYNGTTTKSAQANVSHTSGVGSPKNNINPGGSYTKLDNNGNLYSYTQFDNFGRQTMRIDYQGRPHAETLPHIHMYTYPQQGGRAEYIFDMNWHLID